MTRFLARDDKVGGRNHEAKGIAGSAAGGQCIVVSGSHWLEASIGGQVRGSQAESPEPRAERRKPNLLAP